MDQSFCAFGGSRVHGHGFIQQAQAEVDAFEGSLDGRNIHPALPVEDPWRGLGAAPFVGGAQEDRDALGHGVSAAEIDRQGGKSHK
ncbi:MAG: hypothetical protein MZV64_23535 [Ignavibacteriales bacterium]|nr:hypothetical protein [Ignavibacteriales bacterium]